MVIQPLLIKEKIMRLQRYLAIILAMFTLTSCGYTLTKVEPTTTIAQTTTTTIDFGDDCHIGQEVELQGLVDEVSEAWGTAGTTPTTAEWQARTRALKKYRSFIRGLDIPTIAGEQSALVYLIQEYVDAFNQYMESGKKDLSLNDILIPLDDAENDFFEAWNKVCSVRTNTGA
jgi:hypothetical protein